MSCFSEHGMTCNVLGKEKLRSLNKWNRPYLNIVYLFSTCDVSEFSFLNQDGGPESQRHTLTKNFKCYGDGQNTEEQTVQSNKLRTKDILSNMYCLGEEFRCSENRLKGMKGNSF